MGEEICFDDYLRSVVSAYQQWWRLYTLTDATGRESQQVERDRPAFFNFGLMVQTVEQPKAEQERELESDREKKEKIERLPVLEGICKYAAEHVLLVGRPGSGKSTALARLLLQEAEKALSDRQSKIPVLVELRYLPSEANELAVCDRILAFIHKHDPVLDIDEAGIKLLLRQGRLLLLVDGVNELPSERSRHQVNVFRQDFQTTCPMIFTTRELSTGGDLGIAKRLEMQPLTEAQMQQFVSAYLPTQGENLLRQLSGRLREFGQTPLLLWMLCSLFRQTEQIPPNLGMVFRAFTVGYGDRIKQDVTLSKDSRAWWGRLLQYLAFKMTCGENLTELQVAISRREAEQILAEFLQGKVVDPNFYAMRWLKELLNYHLLQITDNRIEFRYILIQEYYAAEWLLGLLPDLSDARLQHDFLNYLKWTEPLRLMLDLVQEEGQAFRVARLAWEVDLKLGASLAGAAKREFQEIIGQFIAQAIGKMQKTQLLASNLFRYTRSNYTIELLIKALKVKGYEICETNEDIEIVLQTIKNQYPIVYTRPYLLREISVDNAVEILVQALNNEDFKSHVRRNAVEALGWICSDKAISPLIQSLKDIDSHVRRNAAEALGRICSDKAISPLIQSLAISPLIQSLKDLDSDVRRNSAEALGKIGNDIAIEPLIKSLDDLDSGVCWKASEALVSIIKKSYNISNIEKQLPRLRVLIDTDICEEVLSVITAIQSRCKYYNYDIATITLHEVENHANSLEYKLDEIHKTLKTMSETPKYDLRGAKIDKLIDTIGVYNENNFAPEQNLAEAAREIQDLLNQLAKTNPSEATIAETIQQEIKRNPTLKARLVNALKTGGIEALKAIFNNPFVSIPVETVKGFLEAEE